MKKSQISSVILTILFILTINVEICPIISAPIPAPVPQGSFADIFPSNNNTNIELLNASAIITVNATDFLNDIGFVFNGTYSLFNPGSPTNLTIHLPFSLGLDVENANFDVSVNNTQVPYEIAPTTKDNLTSMGLDMDFFFAFIFFKQIYLFTSNFTFLENKTYVVKYQFEGIIPKPNYTRDLLYIEFSTYTTKFWKGNATERVDCIVYGDCFRIGEGREYEGLRQLLDIAGGKRFICEWDNAQNNTNWIQVIFDRREYELYTITPEIIALNIIAYVAITTVIVLWIKRRKKKRF